MITYHWVDNEEQEISSNTTIPANGKLLIRIGRGSKSFEGYKIEICDPFGVIVANYTIPEVEYGEYFQISFPIGNHLVRGDYTIRTKKPNGVTSSTFVFGIHSRRNENQVFVIKNALLLKKMKGQVNKIHLTIDPIPESLFLQSSGITYSGRGTKYEDGRIIIDDIWGLNQKTVKWFNIVQPAFLPIDPFHVQDQPDEFYVLSKWSPYKDEPGLEVSHPQLENYDGEKNPHYPLKVLKSVISYVHQNMRYVKQQQEKGLIYALETGRGDCTEYAAFVVSLLRKNGMKSRLVSGMGRTLYNNWSSHAFIEVFIYGSWFPIDVMKPAKPYLQIGNRGDLIGVSRNNWLDENKNELSIQMQASRNVKPKINFERSVTESGINAIPPRVRSKPRKHLLNKRKKLGVQNKNGTIYIEKIPKSTSTIALIDGNFHFGSIVYLNYYSQGIISIDLSNYQFAKNDIYLVGVNPEGTILAYAQLNPNQLRQS